MVKKPNKGQIRIGAVFHPRKEGGWDYEQYVGGKPSGKKEPVFFPEQRTHRLCAKYTLGKEEEEYVWRYDDNFEILDGKVFKTIKEARDYLQNRREAESNETES